MGDFSRLMTASEKESQLRLEIIDRFETLATETFSCKVVVFGSQGTGLFLPEADIDIVIQMDKAKEEEDQDDCLSGLSPLTRLADTLRIRWKGELSYLEVVMNTRIPIVKFTHGP